MSDHKKKNQFVTNTSGGLSFGTMPINNHGFAQLEIRLKTGYIGKGWTRQGAYGVRHIFEKHGSELNLTCPSQVSSFIESIITTGAEVIIDNNKDPLKPLIIESNNGMVITAISGCQSYYNIISAYDRKQHPGIVIANF